MAKAKDGSSKAPKKKLTEGEVFNECLDAIDELVHTLFADPDFDLTESEDLLLDDIANAFVSQSEIAGDGKPLPLTIHLKEICDPLIAAGRSIDLCAGRNSLKALYWKAVVAKTAKDALKQLKLSKGFRGFLEWVGWRKSSVCMWINLLGEFGTELLKMPAGISQNKLEEIYRVKRSQALDWTSRHLDEIAQAPNVEAVQKLLGTYKEKSANRSCNKAKTGGMSGSVEEVIIGKYTAGFQTYEDGKVTAIVDLPGIDDKTWLIEALQARNGDSKPSTAVDIFERPNEGESPEEKASTEDSSVGQDLNAEKEEELDDVAGYNPPSPPPFAPYDGSSASRNLGRAAKCAGNAVNVFIGPKQVMPGGDPNLAPYSLAGFNADFFVPPFNVKSFNRGYQSRVA